MLTHVASRTYLAPISICCLDICITFALLAMLGIKTTLLYIEVVVPFSKRLTNIAIILYSIILLGDRG